MQRKTGAFKLLAVKNFIAAFFLRLGFLRTIFYQSLTIQNFELKKCSPVLCRRTVSVYCILYLEQKKLWFIKNVIQIIELQIGLNRCECSTLSCIMVQSRVTTWHCMNRLLYNFFSQGPNYTLRICSYMELMFACQCQSCTLSSNCIFILPCLSDFIYSPSSVFRVWNTIIWTNLFGFMWCEKEMFSAGSESPLILLKLYGG